MPKRGFIFSEMFVCNKDNKPVVNNYFFIEIDKKE